MSVVSGEPKLCQEKSKNIPQDIAMASFSERNGSINSENYSRNSRGLSVVGSGSGSLARSQDDSSKLSLKSVRLGSSFGKARRILVHSNDLFDGLDGLGEHHEGEVTSLPLPAAEDSVAQAAAHPPTNATTNTTRAAAPKPDHPLTTSIMSHWAVGEATVAIEDLNSPSPPPTSHTLEASSFKLTPSSRKLSPMDRQEAALRVWINSMVGTATSGPHESPSTDAAGGTTRITAAAPTRAALRLAGRIRGFLMKIYTQDEELLDAMLRIERRVESGQLRAANAEAMLQGVRQTLGIRRTLGAYHPLWLRPAAEIAVGRTSGTVPLEDFIKTHLLADAPLLAVHKGQRTPVYWSQLGVLVAKRLLLVVALLDRAGVAGGPSGSPLVFRPGKGVSTSAAALQAAAGAVLRETDIGRYLGRLGYRVSYVQTPKQEFRVTVSNLAVDMRDGLRLCRLVEEVMKGSAAAPLVFEAARFPANRRPDRLYNINLALEVLQAAGVQTAGVCVGDVDGNAVPAAIVNGDRSATLCLLWRLVLQHELPRLADVAELYREIDHLGLATPKLERLEVRGQVAEDAGRCAANANALLRWVSAVSGKYGVEVRNFEEDMADGRAFCVLAHHYLGSSELPLTSIKGLSAGFSGTAMGGRAVRANFAALHVAADKLGVPIIVTADEFLEKRGVDPRTIALFTALLCHRLIEANREHRAAMVIQRRWRQRAGAETGTARKHLHTWIGAASVVQRCVRRWLFIKGLQQFREDKHRFENAITKLQAAWKARPYRAHFLEARAAAVVIQTGWRGVLARREFMNTITIPKIAAVALKRRAQLIAANQEWSEERAAITIQAVWRGTLQRQRYQQLLKNLEEQRAATVIQAAWRGTLQRRKYIQMLQEIEENQAAVVIQAVWRGVIQRREYQQLLRKVEEQRAAVVIQSTWRGVLQRQSYLQMRRKVEEKRAATAIQAVWRGVLQRRQYQELRQEAAVVRIQTAWRRHVARASFLRVRKAAICIQRFARGALARKESKTRRAAIITIQRQFRHCLEVRKARAVEQTKRRMAELARVMYQYAARSAAAKRIQAAWRGHLGRKHYKTLLAAKAEVERQHAQRRAAAGALIASWGPTFRDRQRFLASRRAALVIQSVWRQHHAARSAAAIKIQKNVRAFLAVQKMQRTKAAALVIQTAWRGYAVRAKHPDAARLRSARARLGASIAASAPASGTTQKITLESRTAAALSSLQSSRGRLPSATLLQDLVRCTEASLACCAAVVDAGAVPTLLTGATAAGRDKTQGEQLQLALAVIMNVCSSRSLVGPVFTACMANGSIEQLGELLQQLREREEPFMAAIGVLERLTSKEGCGEVVRQHFPEVVTRLEGIARVLGHKRASAAAYLTKLEAQKGSDASARQATRGLVAMTKQLQALGKVLAALGARDLDELLLVVGRESLGPGLNATAVKGKNTIVRSVLAEISNGRGRLSLAPTS